MDDLVKRLRDLASLEAEAMPPGWKDAYWLYRAAADRIEADAKRITELALDALAAGTQADEAYQAQLAAEARVKVLEGALLQVFAVSKDHTGHNLPQVTRLAQRIAAIARAALEGEKT